MLSLLGTRKNNFSFYFKCNYLTIRAVKFCEMFCTCSPSSLGQDPMVESAKKKLKKIHLGLFSKKWHFWGVFFHKKGLSWRPTCSCLRCWRPSVLPIRACLPIVAHRVCSRHQVRAIASGPACPMTWRSRWQPTWTR
jgi:hypothetical protein